MNESPIIEIRRKMTDFYKSLTKGLFFDRFNEGKTICMSLKQNGPFQIWYEEPKPQNERSDRLKEAEAIILMAVGSITPYKGENGLPVLDAAVQHVKKYDLKTRDTE